MHLYTSANSTEIILQIEYEVASDLQKEIGKEYFKLTVSEFIEKKKTWKKFENDEKIRQY